MRKAFPLLLLSLATVSQAEESTPWVEDSKQLSCTPRKLYTTGALSLKLGPDHGRELAVRRDADNTWYFLVVSSPPSGVKTLMSPDEFELKTQVLIPASLVTTEWTTNEDTQIFTASGSYTIFVSVALESEAGGYKCQVKYVR